MGRIGLTTGNYSLSSAEEMFNFGAWAASVLPKNSILALSGDLGAGKTTFVQGLASGLGILEKVQSPTFVILNVYEGLAHFDLYRLKGLTDFTNLGFEEYFNLEQICAIEWPDRIREILPPETVHIRIEHKGGGRTLKILC